MTIDGLMLCVMVTTLKRKRLTERVTQSAGSLTVTRGGVPITLKDIDTTNEWRDLPGETVIHGVRIMNRESKNGVIYEDGFVRKVAEIHSNHHASRDHEDVYATKAQPQGRRPTETRFGRFFGGRVIEEKGVAYAVDADLGIYEGDRKEADTWVVKALRNPSSLMFSIEVDAPPAWDGYDDDEGVTHATGLSEMLDTCAVSRGGTTKSLTESLNPKRRRRQMAATSTQRLLERAETKIEKLQEHCNSCDSDIKTKQSLIEQQEAEIADLKTKLAAFEAKVQENDRRLAVAEMAESAKVRLKESEIARYAKWTDEEVKEQLAKDAKLQEREESESFRSAPTKGKEDTSDIEFDVPEEMPIF